MNEPESLHIRPARHDEQRFIRRLVRDARLDPTSLKWRNFLVAELGGVVVGCGQTKPYPGCRELGSLVVRKAYRRQGVAGALIRALLEREQGDVYLMCRDMLVPYYAKFGFAEVGWRDAPPVIRLKLGGGLLVGAVFGIRIVGMRRAG